MAMIRKRSWTTPGGEQRQDWGADYPDTEGQRRLRTFQRKKDADAFLKQIQAGRTLRPNGGLKGE